MLSLNLKDLILPQRLLTVCGTIPIKTVHKYMLFHGIDLIFIRKNKEKTNHIIGLVNRTMVNTAYYNGVNIDSVNAKSIMIHPTHTLEAKDSIDQALHVFNSFSPVYVFVRENNKIIGAITKEDIQEAINMTHVYPQSSVLFSHQYA